MAYNTSAHVTAGQLETVLSRTKAAYDASLEDTLEEVDAKIAEWEEEVSDLTEDFDFDGLTADEYKVKMRRWFLNHGAADATAEELTALCDEWYAKSRDSWNGYVTFYQPDVSAVSTGTKGGDNADLTCEPSTDTVEGQDDYAALPLFACVDVNCYVDADTLEPVITAIDGITDGFVRTDPDTFVGVMQMSGWHWWTEDDETYTHGYSATRSIAQSNIEPLAEAVRVDGTIREWVVHAKYTSGLNDSKLTSYSGAIPINYISHNTCITYANNIGSQYSGYTVADDAFMKLMYYIKYGSLASDGTLQGIYSSISKQYYALVAEEGVQRILVDNSYDGVIEVGMHVQLGNYSSTDASVDRSKSSMYSISGKNGCLVTATETVTVDDTDYTAIYVDCDAFDTSANGAATDGTTYISTLGWVSGTTDAVYGNDGSVSSNTDGKHPCKLQGIEIMSGLQEVLTDCIFTCYADDDGVYQYEPYVVKLAANQSTSVTSNYESTGIVIEQEQSSAAWTYIKKLNMSGGNMLPIEVGGSSSTYTKDGFYRCAASTSAREGFVRGYLNNGSTNDGLSCLYASNTLSNASWSFGARLSFSGNRGEWTE